MLRADECDLGTSWPVLHSVEVQPLSRREFERVARRVELAGSPLTKEQQAELRAALYSKDANGATEKIQQVLDPLCLVAVEINPESRVKAQIGPVPKTLHEQGWRTFLIKVVNKAGVTAPLRCTSPNARADPRLKQ